MLELFEIKSKSEGYQTKLLGLGESL